MCQSADTVCHYQDHKRQKGDGNAGDESCRAETQLDLDVGPKKVAQTAHLLGIKTHLDGVPAEGLVPLMTRTIENGFDLTGPIARGDWATVEAHERAIREAHPELEQLYETLAEATVTLA